MAMFASMCLHVHEKRTASDTYGSSIITKSKATNYFKATG